MIESIEIENLRGIAHGKLEGLTPLTILVGPNGSGKSTILDAFLLAASSDTNEATRLVLSRRSGDHDQEKWLLRKYKDSKIRIRSENEGIFRDVGIQFNQETETLDFNFPGKDENASWFELLFSQPPKSGTNIIDHRNHSLQKPLHELYSEVAKYGGRDFINSLLQEIIPNFSNIEILTEKSKSGIQVYIPVVNIVYSGTAGSVPVSLAGDGIHALVRMAMEIQLSQGLALIEEPEAHQHPATIRQIAKAIFASVRKDNQVILTTHSLEFIDALVEQATTEEELKLITIFRVKLRNGELLSSCTRGTDITFARNDIGEDLR